MTHTSKLPDKLTDLIELALKDLTEVEALPVRYTVRMSFWHAPAQQMGIPGGDQCMVCLAGAVMARTLALPDDVEIDLLSMENYMSGVDRRKLEALDYVRKGDLVTAANITCIDQPKLRGNFNRLALGDGVANFSDHLSRYEVNPEKWRMGMRRAIEVLKLFGF